MKKEKEKQIVFNPSSEHSLRFDSASCPSLPKSSVPITYTVSPRTNELHLNQQNMHVTVEINKSQNQSQLQPILKT